ncbi:MAG: ATP phosphoribosyltransferase regulatory subunit [Pleurocapsa sp.]
MIYQPPAGARDLLPLEVEQKRWINDCLQTTFQQWGYQRIVTSTLEWLDTLTAGGAIKPATVIQLRKDSEQTLGLRPELTASIARAAVTRMAGNTSLGQRSLAAPTPTDCYPQRLCYRANVFRNPPQNHHGRQLEFYQAGVELLFAGGILADSEIILLLAECLATLGVPNWSILLGEAGLTRSLLAVFPDDIKPQVCQCIANLDRITLENLPLEPRLKARALCLFDLRGQPEEVLAKVASLDLDSSAQTTVHNLKSLISLLQNSSPIPLPLTLDLSLLQTFDYYTGIVFKAVCFQGNQSYLLGEGGRYDRLLGLYHPQGETSPGIGFSLNIEDLHSCLLTTERLPQQAPASNYLVIATTPQVESTAFQYARQLRKGASPEFDSGACAARQEGKLTRVEIDLGGRSEAEIRKYARSCRIERLIWIQADGSQQVEVVADSSN